MLAKAQGRRREAGSGGSVEQSRVLTNRNRIRGNRGRTSGRQAQGFRFTYQREYRFVSYQPQVTRELSAPLRLRLGPLNDIGKVIVL